MNTKNKNTGNRNSGDWNSGNRNSGDWNSGYGNSGDWNSGYGNSGYWNSGNRNSGYWNSGYGNSTDRETGIFNSTGGKIRCFNKETDLTWDEIEHPTFKKFHLTKWIYFKDMTKKEKKDNLLAETTDGYLKTFTWKEAWANYWRDSDEEEKEKVLNLPNFDKDIFKEITGIEVDQKEVSLSGKEVEVVIDGKKYTAIIK